MTLLTMTAHEGGWLVAGEDAPIGFIDGDGGIVTPSGAEYSVAGSGDVAALIAADGSAVATLNGAVLLDVNSGVEWRVRPDWANAVEGGVLRAEDVWAEAYTLEDAQGTVPNRVRLLLAWVVATSGTGFGSTVGDTIR